MEVTAGGGYRCGRCERRGAGLHPYEVPPCDPVRPGEYVAPEPECVTGRPLRVPTFEMEVSEALAAVETGVADAKGDLEADGREVGESDLYPDIAGSVASLYPAQVGREVRRRLGFDADDGPTCEGSADYPDHPPVWRTP